MRALLVLATALWPAAAWADGFTAAYAAFQVFWAAVGTYVTVAIIVYGAVNARRQARKAAAKARNAYNAGLEDRSVTLLQAAPPWRVVYGRCITGGDIVAIFTTDKAGTRPDGSAYTKADALKHLVIVFAAHQCQAINEVFIDGVAVGALDGSGLPTGGEFYSTETNYREISIAAGGSSSQPYPVTVLTSYRANPADSTTMEAATYTVTGGGLTINNTSGVPAVVTFTMPVPKPTVRINKHLGTDTQVVDAYLNGVAPTQWTANHRLRGLCYMVLTLDLEDPRFQGGPPNPTADISGKLLFDTRTSTTAYSANPALVVRDFLVSPWGYECLAADIDTPFCNAAANACDALISLDVGGVVTTNQPTYTCNGAFSTEAGREAVLEDLVEAMAGFAVYGAKWQIVAGTWTAPVAALTDDDLMGQIEVVQADAGMEEAFNGVRGVYIAAGKSSPTDFDSYQNAAFRTADGVDLWSDLTLPYTDNKARCRNLSRIFVERARNALVIRYPAKFKAWPLQVGDRVTVTSAEYGFSAKNFRVTDWQFGVTSPVVLLLQEDEAAAYDLADAATADPTPNTNLPNPWAVATLSGVTATSGTAQLIKLPDGTIDTRVKVSWAAIADAYVTDGSGEVRILWRRMLRDPANVFQTVVVPGNATDAYITGLSSFDVISLQVFAVNGLGARGNPVVLAHVVVGKAAAPADVSGLSAAAIPGAIRITWAPNTETDHAVTELRRGASWAAGVRVDTGGVGSTEVAGNSYDWSWPAIGAYTLWARHRDTTGNLSAAAATLVITVTGGDIAMGGGNLLSNSSFEADSDADGLADNWEAYSNGTTGTVTYTIVPGGMASGNAQHIAASGLGTATSDHAGIRQIVDVAQLAGLPFTLSAWVTVSAALPKLRLNVDFFNGLTYLSSATQQLAPTTGAVRYAMGGTIPASSTIAKAYLWEEARPSAAGAANVVIDWAQFEPGVMTAYAPRADEILVGQVGTVELADEAATALGNWVGGSSTISYPLGPDIGGDTTNTLLTGTYTNTTAEVVKVQFEVAILNIAFGPYNGGVNAMTEECSWSYTTGSSGSGSRVFMDNFVGQDFISFYNQSTGVDVGYMTLNPGDTITLLLKYRFAHNRASSSTLDASSMRIAAIKR